MATATVNRKVCMLVMNGVVGDPRVTREALHLQGRGYDVVVIGLPVSGATRGDIRTLPFAVRLLSDTSFLTSIKKMLRWGRGRASDTSGKTVGAPVDRGRSLSLWADVLRLAALFYRNITMGFAAVREDVAVFHSHDLDTLLAGVLASRLRGVALIYDSHELYTEMGFHTTLFNRTLHWLEKICIKFANRVITVNDSIAGVLHNRYGIAMPSVVMNCPSVPTSASSPSHPVGKAVLYQGVYQEERGLENLIRSVAYLPEGALLYFRGYGPLEQTLRNLVLAERVEGRVIFLPPVAMQDMVEAAAFADVGVVPYLGTTLNNLLATPNKLFEYMGAGLAVVATNSPELARIITDEGIGDVFDARDPVDIGRALTGLLVAQDRLREAKGASYKAFVARYNWSHQAKELERVYAEVLS